MKKGKQKLTKFIQKHWVAAYFCAALMIAVVVNIGMSLPITSFNTLLDEDDWLTFWGSYLGGAIGCLPALAAYRHSIDESNRQHQEFQEQLQESRKQAGEQYGNMEKDRHLSHLPVIDNQLTYIKSIADLSSSFSSICVVLKQDTNASGHFQQAPDISEINEIIKTNRYDVVLLKIRNIGHGPALAIGLHFASSSFSIGTLAEQESCMVLLCLERTDTRAYHLEFSFSDMLGWNYQQSHDFQIGIARLFSAPIQPPERVE